MTSPKTPPQEVPEQKGTLAVGRLMLVAANSAAKGRGVGRSGAAAATPRDAASREDAKAVVSIVRAAIQTRTVNQDEIRARGRVLRVRRHRQRRRQGRSKCPGRFDGPFA